METIRHTFEQGGDAYFYLTTVGDWLSDILGESNFEGGYDSFEECELDNQYCANAKLLIGNDSFIKSIDKYAGPGYELWHIIHKVDSNFRWQWDVLVRIEDSTIAVQYKLSMRPASSKP